MLMRDYKSLGVMTVIWATQVNTQTDRQPAFEQLYTISSDRLAKNYIT